MLNSIGAPLELTGGLTLGFLPLGVFLARTHRRNRVSWLVLAVGVVGLVALVAALGSAWAPAAWAAQWTWWPPIPLMLLALLYFPDGQLPSPRWRVPAAVIAVAGVLGAVLMAAALVADPDLLIRASATHLPGARLAALGAGACVAVILVSTVPTAWSLYVRWRRASPLGRRQIACLAPSIALLAIALPIDALGTRYLIVLALLSLPLGMTVAILHYRLHDLDTVINRSVVWAVMTGLGFVSYAGLAMLASRLFPHLGAAELLIGFALFVAVFDPARQVVQRRVNRSLYGDRDEPYRVLADLGSRMTGAVEPRQMLQAVPTAIGAALKVPYCAVVMRIGDEPVTVAEDGRRLVEPEVFALRIADRDLGDLLVSPRRAGERFTTAEHDLLVGLAQQIAVGCDGYRLTLALERSRTRLVMGREEERRRLRHDLHDGVGPTLVGTRMQLATARALCDQDEVRDLLSAAIGDLTNASAEVRGLIDGLRPAVLDAGLATATRNAAERVLPGTRVDVHAVGEFVDLPAAVEVAAYRIATEALANVAKHAHAGSVRVELVHEPQRVTVTVSDDGRGGADARPGGVGLESMAQRAEELGGSLRIDSPGTGTTVTAHLPVLAR